MLGGERSPTEWYLLLCALRVWSADPARPDGTYKEFATRVSPFSSLHDVARVVDAMQPRGVGALLYHELGWVDAHGALRRVADCLPFDDSEKPRASVCARRFWAHGQRAAADASAHVSWPDVSPPGWRLLRATGGTVEAVAPDGGGLPLFWSTESLLVLTPASTHRARVIEASVLGPRRGRASTLDAAPAVLDPLAAVTFSDDAMMEEMGASSLTYAVRGNNAAAALLLRLRSSRRLVNVPLYPPSERLARAVAHHLADHDGVRTGQSGATPGKHVRGLSTNGSLQMVIGGWLDSLCFRGTPAPDATRVLVLSFVGRTLARLFPSVVFRRPPNFVWDCVEAAERICPGVSDWSVHPSVHRLDALQACALSLVETETGRRNVTVLELRIGGLRVHEIAGFGWPVTYASVPCEFKNQLEPFGSPTAPRAPHSASCCSCWLANKPCSPARALAGRRCRVSAAARLAPPQRRVGAAVPLLRAGYGRSRVCRR